MEHNEQVVDVRGGDARLSLTQRVDRFQRRHPVAGFPVGVIYKFGEDQGPYLAALITYYSFLSLFPLLLLLTNDGELAHRLSHPSYEVPKTYLAEVLGPMARDVGKRLREGVQLEDGIVRVDSFKLIDSTSNKVLVELVLHEGRKHIVRRALAEVGHPVQQLVRTAVGPVQLGSQKPGKIRVLTRDELAGLFKLVAM